MPISRDRARLYRHIRSAHLERALQLPPATIVYGDTRYDYDERLAGRLQLVRAKGVRAAWYLVRHPAAVLEINEPLVLSSVRSSAVVVCALRLLGRLRPPRTEIVAYAIENLDPRSQPRPRDAKGRLARRLDLLLALYLWRRLDRVAFGTETARDLYASALPAAHAPHCTVIPALPRAADDADAAAKDPRQVVFLGAFLDRKGFSLLVEAWPLVLREQPEARLALIGLGRLQAVAEQLAASQPGVELHADPPRPLIRRLLQRSQVLVLASQRQPRWREQVGLPIVEGLSYGCTVVTTTETGLAPWLSEHGHVVLAPGSWAAELAGAVLAALGKPVEAAEVLASLPAEDGRLAADAWMFGSRPAPAADARAEATARG